MAEMVRARLKPAYSRGAMTKATFKEVARAATRAAAAAAAAAALKLHNKKGGNNSDNTADAAAVDDAADAAEGVNRLAVISAAVDRAVEAALRNAGVAP